MAARLLVARFARDGRGATAIEYAMIGGLIFVVIVASVTTFGNKTSNLMQTVSNQITAAIGN